ncbi:hypothetical protein NMB33_11575 [Burkholderia sp. FXe9]|nr:hypothetical protein NMB33_11575 [Burkholderia sp. FXe9]
MEVNYGNFKLIDGLQIPLRIESGTAASPTKDTLIIDKVSLNPPLDDALFGRPVSPGGRRAASIDARVSAAPPGVARPTARP